MPIAGLWNPGTDGHNSVPRRMGGAVASYTLNAARRVAVSCSNFAGKGYAVREKRNLGYWQGVGVLLLTAFIPRVIQLCTMHWKASSKIMNSCFARLTFFASAKRKGVDTFGEKRQEQAVAWAHRTLAGNCGVYGRL